MFIYKRVVLLIIGILLIISCNNVDNTMPLDSVCPTTNNEEGVEPLELITAQPLASKYKIYNITNHYDLNSQCVIIPPDAILFFKGGSISNGTIVGNNTRIFAGNTKIFDKINLQGSFVSDKILLSWWVTPNEYDNTSEVQSAINSILFFNNRVLLFDTSIRIRNVSFVLKWAPGVTFEGVSNSPQGNISLTVFGSDSNGLDISGSENLQFENLYFQGDEDDPPKSLLFASRVVENKQCQGHTFDNVYFRGNVTKSLVYNYAGELWTFNNCKFRLYDNSVSCAAVYCTSVNTQRLLSKFGTTEQDITTLTCLNFENCWFYNRTKAPTIYIEGGRNESNKLCNAASISIDHCYFYTPYSTSVLFADIYGGVHINGCVDESGADNSCKGDAPFYAFEGNTLLSGLSITNNTFYARKNSYLIEAVCPIANYYAFSNYVINSPGIWCFTDLTNACHMGLSSIERFIVTGKRNNVLLNNLDYV